MTDKNSTLFFVQLTEREQDVIRQCMNTIFKSPYIDNPEFETRLGIDRKALQKVMQCWPDLNDSDEHSVVFLAINNCLNEICYGIDISPSDWALWFDASIEDVRAVFEKWCRIRSAANP